MKENPTKTKEVFQDGVVGRLSGLMKSLAVAVCAFGFGAGSIFGVISPFATALTAAVPISYLPTAAIGSIISMLVFSPSAASGYRIASIIAAVLLRYCLHRVTTRKLKPAFIGLISLCSILLVGIVRIQINDYKLYELLLLGIEIVLCGCMGYFFAIAANALFKKSGLVFSYIQLISISVCFIGVVCSFSSVRLFNVNIGVVIGTLALYLIIIRYAASGGSIGAIIIGLAFALCSPDFLPFAAIFVISGFLASVFSPLGKPFIIASFVIITSFFALLSGASSFMIYNVISVFIASALFVFLPKKVMAHVELTCEREQLKSNAVQKNAEAKLRFAGETIMELSEEIGNVSKRFDEINYENPPELSDCVSDSVCKGCTMALQCWDSQYNETADAMNKMTKTAAVKGFITQDDMPQYLFERCCKPNNLINAVNNLYMQLSLRKSGKRRQKETKSIALEQLSSLSDMLFELSGEIGQICGYDEKAASKTATAFKRLEAEPLQVVCALDEFSRMAVEIYTDNVIKTNPEILCEAVSDACDRFFELPQITSAGGKTRIAFYEKAKYGVEFDLQQSCKNGNSVCGDCFESFCDGNGFNYFLLSDGMGSGSRAAIDSAMTCSIMAKLIKSGFGLESAVKLINSSLLLKSTDESLSTIDLLRIDVYTGECVLVKSGAADSFICSSGEIEVISSQALPIGILQQSECEKTTFRMKNGDMLVLCSDGALVHGEDYVKGLIRHNTKLSCKELAVLLCGEAKTENSHDDISVAVIRLYRE